MHAELCPVCEGAGVVILEEGANPIDCYGCDGDGWVEVHNDPEYVPYPFDCDQINITAAPFVYPYDSFH